jgi:GNAT superfamily N-acetyltransferase
MNIRLATEHDIPMMAELLHELFAIEADFTPDYARQARGLHLLMNSDRAVIFVAEVKGEVVGMCTVQVVVSTAAGAEVGSVEDVVVDIEHRGKGIGTSLLHTMEEWAADRGLARLQLLADLDNHSGIRFYRSHAWNPTNLACWMKPLPRTGTDSFGREKHQR